MGQTTRSYIAGFFQMALDGERNLSYLKRVNGGLEHQEFAQEGFGDDNKRLIHGTVANIDEISFEFGMAGAAPILKWIKESWDKDFGRRSGQIDHADFNTNIVLTQEFSNALITETTFPTLDGSANENAYLRVKFMPEGVDSNRAGGKLDGDAFVDEKQWNCSLFRFSIDDVPGVEYSNRIESFSVKQKVMKLATGEARFPELFPVALEFPQIVGTVAEAYGAGLWDWHDEYIRKGRRDPKALKTAHLEILAPDMSVLWRVNFFHVGLKKLEVADSTANSGQIKRLKYTLTVESMELDGRYGFET